MWGSLLLLLVLLSSFEPLYSYPTIYNVPPTQPSHQGKHHHRRSLSPPPASESKSAPPPPASFYFYSPPPPGQPPSPKHSRPASQSPPSPPAEFYFYSPPPPSHPSSPKHPQPSHSPPPTLGWFYFYSPPPPQYTRPSSYPPPPPRHRLLWLGSQRSWFAYEKSTKLDVTALLHQNRQDLKQQTVCTWDIYMCIICSRRCVQTKKTQEKMF